MGKTSDNNKNIQSRSLNPTLVKQLFADSGNLCAFPECTQELFTEHTLIGEICHIEGLKPKSARYNANNKSPNDYDNLIVLCSNRHKVIDSNPQKYTVKILKELKENHAEINRRKNYKISEEMMKAIEEEYRSFYDSIKDNDPMNVGDLKMTYDLFVAPDLEVIEQLQEDFDGLRSHIDFTISNVKKESDRRNINSVDFLPFESTCLGIPNFTTRIELHLASLKVRAIKSLLENNPNDSSLQEKFQVALEDFKKVYEDAYYND